MLGRKLARDLRRQRGQVLAALAVTALGVMLFVASAGAYVDLRGSYAATRRELALADLHVDVTDPVTAADVARVAALPGVSSADARDVVELPVRIADTRLSLRALSLPERGQPALDRVLVLEGRLPGDGEVLVEKHLAQHHHLAPGAEIAVASPPRRLRVSGVAVSAEHLWVARDRVDFLPDPDEFGVGWMTSRALRGLPASGHQLLVELRDGGGDHEAAAAAAIVRALGPGRVIRATPEDELVGVRLLQLDVDGYRGMAAFFPALFLGVGAFIVAAILARLVDAQRALVGTLMALGVGRGRVLAHYLAYGVVLGATGAVLGGAAGALLAPAMTHAYARELGIPFVATHVHGALAAWGLALGVAVAAVAALIPAIHASRLTPASAMRPPRPSTGPLARAARRLRAPLPLEMALRDLLGRPLRSLATAAGVAAALVVVITTGGLLDSMRATSRATFSLARADDLRVELAAPAPPARLRERFAAIPGVTRVEPLATAPVALAAGAERAEAVVQGLPDDAALVRSVDADGAPVPPRPGEIVLTRSLGRALHVARGDLVELRWLAAAGSAPAPAGSAASPIPATASPAPRLLRVGGFADAALGPLASVRAADLPRELGATSVALAIDPAHRREARAAIAALPDVARIQDTASLRAQMAELMQLGWVMLGAMLAFAAVLAAAILFSTATLGVLERRRDLATLRAFGRTLRELALALTLEHGLLALAGVALGLPAACVITRRLVGAFSSDLFALPFVISPATLTISIAGVLLVLLLAQWPALRAVGRMSLAEAVRSRES